MKMSVSENIETKKERALRILSSVYNLPTVPFIIFEVTKILEDPMASAAQLGKIIGKDQGLVTKILSVANSPLYGIPRRVSTIDFAIVILGFNHIKNIVIALSMMDTLKKFGDGQFQQKQYWMHSFITATASKRIADDLGITTSGEAFTAGLLHDLGIPIIYKYFNKEYLQISRMVQETGMDFLDAEREVLGLTHAEIGKHLIDRWNLPSNLADVALNHHNPAESEQNIILASLVHLADYMTDKLHIGNFSWDAGTKLDHSIIDTLKLQDEEYLEKFIQSYEEPFKKQADTIKI